MKGDHWLSRIAGRPVSPPLPTSLEDLVAARADDTFRRLSVDLPTAVRTKRVRLRERDGRTLTAEIHVPDRPGPLPVLLFLHGGAWHTGSAEDERALAAHVADTGVVVVALDYALAPEAPYPAGLADCVYAARWVVRHIDEHGGDPDRVAIGGASAGANLAAAVVEHLHGGAGNVDEDGDAVRFSAAVLLYGVYDAARWVADPGPFAGAVEWILAGYLGPNWSARTADPLVSPLRGALDRFPRTYVVCGDRDSLLGHSLSLVAALAEQGVPVTASVLADADHCALNIPHLLPAAAREIDRIGAWLTRPDDG